MTSPELVASPHRLGRSAITLHTDQSNFIPVISELSYNRRILRRPWVSYMGARPIHRTTLALDRSKPKLDYLTLYKHYFQGSTHLKGARRPPTCPSMFTSQWDIGENRKMNFVTQTDAMFPPKTGEPVTKMRKVQVQNRFNNTHGQQMMDVTDMDTGPSYFTSYRVAHDELGKQRGEGVPHTRKQPPRFNVITGETLTASDKVHHRRKSGNRVLFEQRKKHHIAFELH